MALATNPSRATSSKAHWMLLVARPARTEDVCSLERIASNVAIGNTRPDQDRIIKQIELSEQVLSNPSFPPRQGIIYLVTEMYKAGKPPKIVGHGKLQYAASASWQLATRARSHDNNSSVDVPVLRYSSELTEALEIAGNAVLPAFRNMKIGKFQTFARVLFAVQHKMPGVKLLFADLLTQRTSPAEATGKKNLGKPAGNSYRFPFYEQVVRPLLGNVEYDEADLRRYDDIDTSNGSCAFLNSHLGSQVLSDGRVESAVELVLHALPPSVLKYLGKVGKDTVGAEKSLRAIGFRESDKRDILDGGKYMLAELDHLNNTTNCKKKKIQICPDDDDDVERKKVVFTPSVDRARYSAMAVHGDDRDSHLRVHASVAKLAGLVNGQTVTVMDNGL